MLSPSHSKHLPTIFILLFLSLVVTYPLATHIVIGTDTLMLSDGADTFMKFWDAWHMGNVFNGEHPYYYTTEIYYPNGVSLSAHSISLPFMLIMYGMDSLLPQIMAFHVTSLILLWITVISGYIYMYSLTENRWISLFGTCLFAFSLMVISDLERSDLSFLATIPLGLYCLERAIRSVSLRWGILAGLIGASTIFIGGYLFVCFALTAGIRVLTALSVNQQWRNFAVWRVLIVFSVMFALVTLVRLVPVMQESTSPVEKYPDLVVEVSSDLLLSFVHAESPIFGTFQSDLWGYDDARISQYYLSYIGFLLIIVGLIRRNYRKHILAWLPIFLVFFVLRLGSHLTINDVTNFEILLPKYYLDQLLPSVFDAFWLSGHFQAGVVLPFAVMASYGVLSLLNLTKSQAVRIGLIALLTTVVLVETHLPIDFNELERENFIFFEELAQGEHEQGAIINLPMGRTNSKHYNFHQTVHQQPQVEGAISRVFEDTYDYINSNAVLNRWNNLKTFKCNDETQTASVEAFSQLIDDGFVYVIVHKTRQKSQAHKHVEALSGYTPYYKDDYLLVYTVSHLRDVCATSA